MIFLRFPPHSASRPTLTTQLAEDLASALQCQRSVLMVREQFEMGLAWEVSERCTPALLVLRHVCVTTLMLQEGACLHLGVFHTSHAHHGRWHNVNDCMTVLWVQRLLFT